MLVLRVRQRACRGNDRQKGARHIDLGEGTFEVGDVALDLRVRVGQRAGDNKARAEPFSQARDAIVLGIEFRKRHPVLAAPRCGHGVARLRGGQRPSQHAAEAIVNVKSPVTAFAEFAIADDVDAGLGLPADHRLNRLLQAFLVGRRIVRFSVLDFM